MKIPALDIQALSKALESMGLTLTNLLDKGEEEVPQREARMAGGEELWPGAVKPFGFFKLEISGRVTNYEDDRILLIGEKVEQRKPPPY